MILKEISSLIKSKFFLSSIKCVNELKQDMDTEQEIYCGRLW